MLVATVMLNSDKFHHGGQYLYKLPCGRIVGNPDGQRDACSETWVVSAHVVSLWTATIPWKMLVKHPCEQP